MSDTSFDPIEIIRSEARAVALCFGLAAPDDAADSIVKRIQSRLAGVHVYIPSQSARDRERIHNEIRLRFTGGNVGSLAREFGLTPRGVRKIIAGAKVLSTSKVAIKDRKDSA